jgi:hypothetical protein
VQAPYGTRLVHAMLARRPQAFPLLSLSVLIRWRRGLLQRPTTFELKALGLTVQEMLLARADEVIE